jgi:hypothetical protein
MLFAVQHGYRCIAHDRRGQPEQIVSLLRQIEVAVAFPQKKDFTGRSLTSPQLEIKTGIPLNSPDPW